MTEENNAWIKAHTTIEHADGLTVRDLRILLEAVDKIGLPDDAKLFARSKFRGGSRHGNLIKRITAEGGR